MMGLPEDQKVLR